MTDTQSPIAIVSNAIGRDGRDERSDAYAMNALMALLHGGWRIVRTDPCRAPGAPLGHCGCAETRITDEWVIP